MINLIGQQFGKLTAVKRAETRLPGDRTFRWECLCECGKTIQAEAWLLKNGKVKSCGCMAAGRKASQPNKERAATSPATTMLPEPSHAGTTPAPADAAQMCHDAPNRYAVVRKQSNNTTGVTGVCWNGVSKVWRARIDVHGKEHCLYTGTKFEKAVKLRQTAERMVASGDFYEWITELKRTYNR